MLQKGTIYYLKDCTTPGFTAYYFLYQNPAINGALCSVFLALRSFQNRILDKRVLIATDSATVVSYLNKQGGTHSWDMCLLVWRILAYCNPRNILIRARHIQGCLNVIADSLSRKDKIIQTEWSLHPQYSV